MARRFRLVDWIFLAWFAGLLPAVLAAHARVPSWPLVAAIHLAALAGIVLLRRGADAGPRRRFLYDWYPLLVPIVTFEEVAYLSRHLWPGWRDAALLRLEAAIFSTPPTEWLPAHGNVLLTELLSAGYLSYFFYVMVIGGMWYFGARQDRGIFHRLLAAMALAYTLCYLVFLLWPTEGPRWTLAAAHQTELRGGPFYAALLFLQGAAGVHGNAFPSAHAAMGSVALWYAWLRSRRAALVLAPIVLLMCVGAVYTRYHYASDMAAGLAVGALAAAAVELFSRRAGRV